MSEFKFACPVCGQHITCDSATSGTQMDCPTCFRKLVVPQASASGSKNFVLTAAEVQTRTIPLPGNGQASAAISSQPNSNLPMVLFALTILVCGAGAAAFLFREKLFHSDQLGVIKTKKVEITGTNKPVVPVVLLPPSTNWTLNLADAKIPDAPASGNVMGRAFAMERATIQGGRLDLRQGPKWPPDVGLSIHLFADRAEDLAGKTVVLESTRTNAPRVILRGKDEQANPVNKDFRKGYAARVEFGQVTNNRLEGKIYVAIPDDTKSYAAGVFSAEIRKPAPPKK